MKANIDFPKGLYQGLTLFLMIAIGLKGGIALAEHGSSSLLPQSLAVIGLGVVLTLLAFPVLLYVGQLSRKNAASIAAHYGSVSVGTYAVAVALLESQRIDYEAYFPLFVVLLEMPAIVVGLLLVKESGQKVDSKKLLHEVFCNQGIVLMSGALLIGYVAAEQAHTITPLFRTLFHGALALFLLEMGMVAAGRLKQMQTSAQFILSFGIAMPLLGGALGCATGYWIGLSQGGAILLGVLGASASYIAVPAAMRVAIPDADHGLSITASLGVTFPFNVMVGIPTYIVFSQWMAS